MGEIGLIIPDNKNLEKFETLILVCAKLFLNLNFFGNRIIVYLLKREIKYHIFWSIK